MDHKVHCGFKNKKGLNEDHGNIFAHVLFEAYNTPKPSVFLHPWPPARLGCIRTNPHFPSAQGIQFYLHLMVFEWSQHQELWCNFSHIFFFNLRAGKLTVHTSGIFLVYERKKKIIIVLALLEQKNCLACLVFKVSQINIS